MRQKQPQSVAQRFGNGSLSQGCPRTFRADRVGIACAHGWAGGDGAGDWCRDLSLCRHIRTRAPKQEEPHSARTAAGGKEARDLRAQARPEGRGPRAKGFHSFLSLAYISGQRQPCRVSLTSSAAGCNPDLDPEGLTGRLSIVILSILLILFLLSNPSGRRPHMKLKRSSA